MGASGQPKESDAAVFIYGRVDDSGDSYIVNGDAAETRQVNNVHRATMQGRTDTGGQLNMCGDISGELSYFESTITTSEILILATDGLTDNLREDCMSKIVHLICAKLHLAHPQGHAELLELAEHAVQHRQVVPQ